MNTDTGPWKALVGVTFFLAALLRWLGLQSGLWFDEIVALVASVRHPIRDIVTQFPYVNAHPLYNIIAHASVLAFGESAWALRLPAALFGVASVVMVYVIGVRLMSRVEAWAGAAVLAVSYHHIWFSQNGRGYTLLGFLVLLSTYLLLKACETGRRRDFVWYVLVCAAGSYTHLTMALVVGAHALVVLGGRMVRWTPSLNAPIRPLLWAWVGAGLLSALLYAPFLGTLLTLTGGEPTRNAANVATASRALSDMLQSLVSGTGMSALIAAAGFAAVGAISLWRTQPLAMALLVTPGITTVAPFMALGLPIRPRFVFFLSGAAALCVGRGIGAAAETLAAVRARPGHVAHLTVACALALVAMFAAALPRNYQLPKQDFDGAVRFLEGAETDGARVIVAGPSCVLFGMYYGKSWPCLTTSAEWDAAASQATRVLILYTMAEYIDDGRLLENLRANCPVVRQFPGTLGGGDLTVCQRAPGTVAISQ